MVGFGELSGDLVWWVSACGSGEGEGGEWLGVDQHSTAMVIRLSTHLRAGTRLAISFNAGYAGNERVIK